MNEDLRCYREAIKVMSRAVRMPTLVIFDLRRAAFLLLLSSRCTASSVQVKLSHKPNVYVPVWNFRCAA
jgi:hypothetical protein